MAPALLPIDLAALALDVSMKRLRPLAIVPPGTGERALVRVADVAERLALAPEEVAAIPGRIASTQLAALNLRSVAAELAGLTG